MMRFTDVKVAVFIDIMVFQFSAFASNINISLQPPELNDNEYWRLSKNKMRMSVDTCKAKIMKNICTG